MFSILIIFLCGAIVYPLIEVLWQGHSHYTMAIAGGICMILINCFCVNVLSSKNTFIKCLTGSAIITSVEFVAGIILNKVLLMSVWDYSALPLNFMGQICLPFSLIWFFLTLPAMYLCRTSNNLCNRITSKNKLRTTE